MSDDKHLVEGKGEASASSATPPPHGTPDAAPSTGLSKSSERRGDAVPFCEAFTVAYRNLYDKLHAAWNPVEVHQALMEAHAELEKKLAALPPLNYELERCEATAEYLRTVRSLYPTERQRTKIAFAYSRYLDELKAIWSGLDIDKVEPAQLSAFGQSITWAAYFASFRP